MNPEERELLERIMKVSEDNQRLLRVMERRNKWTTIWNVSKLIILIILPLIGYVIIQPYLGQVTAGLNQYKDLLNQI